jgi:two-component system phosphate regulon response regulator PhoB
MRQSGVLDEERRVMNQVQAATILIVEDEPEIGELLSLQLTKSGYRTTHVQSGEDAMAVIGQSMPSLVLLDIMLPGMDGLEVCRRIKWNDTARSIPIIMVSAKGEESDIVTGLELGADDYIVKPFSSKVLIARVRNTLRRSTEPLASKFTKVRSSAGITIDLDRHEINAGGQTVSLTMTEFGIMAFLMRRPGFVRTRDQIIDAVHGARVSLSRRTIDVHITALRRKLGDHGRAIETIRGVGYRIDENLQFDSQ